MVAPAVRNERLAEFIDDYSLRIYPALLEQQEQSVVCSPLGAWLLLAACVSAAGDALRTELEDVLGCSREDAAKFLSAFLAKPPSALRPAIAIWVSAADATDALAAWVRSLPSQVESGYIPAQRDADEWVERNTLGLINSFPVELDALTRIVLASALATKVSWDTPFGVAPARDALGASSPWSASVSRLLWDRSPGEVTMIARTSAAGLVAVHAALATEELTVVSASASPDVPRIAVLSAAHEVAALEFGRRSDAERCSLFDLELGAGHSWSVAEREIYVPGRAERVERITDVFLPAWKNEGAVNLLAAREFGCHAATTALRRLIGPRSSDRIEARQVAVASYTRYGFEAAAVTAFAVAAAMMRPRHRERGLERTAKLRFDHPYAVVAVAGKPESPARGDSGSVFTGVPLFSAWVDEPTEPEDEPPSGS